MIKKQIKKILSIIFILLLNIIIFNNIVDAENTKNINKDYIEELYNNIIQNKLEKSKNNYELVYKDINYLSDLIDNINNKNNNIILLEEIVENSIYEFDEKYFYNKDNNTIYLYNNEYFYKNGFKTYLIKNNNNGVIYNVCDIEKKEKCSNMTNVGFQQEIDSYKNIIKEFKPILIDDNKIIFNKIKYNYQIGENDKIYFTFNKLTDSVENYLFNGEDLVKNLTIYNSKLGYKEYTSIEYTDSNIKKIIENEKLTELLQEEIYYINDLNNFENNLLSIYNKTQNLIKNVNNEEEKISIIYNYISNNFKYDYNVYNYYLSNGDILDNQKSAFSGIGTFNEKVGVCNGFSSLFKLMGEFAGIKDIEIITGDYYDKYNKRPISHAWNKIGDKYYDVTFELGNPNKTDYFLYYGLPEDIIMLDRAYFDTNILEYFKTAKDELIVNYINNKTIQLLEKYNNKYLLLNPEYILYTNNINLNSTLDDVFNSIDKKYTFYSEEGKLENIYDENGNKVNIYSIEAYGLSSFQMLHDIFYKEKDLDIILLKNTFNGEYFLLKNLKLQ